MSRFLHLLLLGLIGAAIVHIAILLLIPHYSDRNAWAELENLGEAYRFHQLSSGAKVLSNPDPLIQQAVCRFDLSDGPLKLATQKSAPFWSLSIYTPNGDNLYSINDNISNDRTLDLVVANPLGVAALRTDSTFDESEALMVSLPIEKGAVILRVLVPDASWQSVAHGFFETASCAPYEVD